MRSFTDAFRDLDDLFKRGFLAKDAGGGGPSTSHSEIATTADALRAAACSALFNAAGGVKRKSRRVASPADKLDTRLGIERIDALAAES